MSSRVVAVERFPSLGMAGDGWATVGMDVIRATTTAISAVATGRRCFPVASLEEAVPLAGRLHNPLLVGELGGNKPYGFHHQNSPAEMARANELDRPVILLSTSGTAMICAAARRGLTYATCLRNVTAQAEHLIATHDRVLLLAGESRGEFRDEDRLCCARIARRLLDAGYQPYDASVERLVAEWGDAPVQRIRNGHSAEYLLRTGQGHDLDFILEHVDDLDAVYELREGELVTTNGNGERT
jgi:2-phosphosulfolactate phosphatase